MIRRLLAVVAARVAVALAAPRGDMKDCAGCGASNEPWRTQCITCGKSF